ncbi:MAG: iron-containing alcohol dehydrogenase [Pseudomonadota bacterium]
MPSFSFLSPVEIVFGRGTSRAAASRVAAMGPNILLVHGAEPARAAWLRDILQVDGCDVQTVACPSEPDLPMLDAARETLVRPYAIVALGGGAVVDFGKALAALLPCKGPSRDYLEIVGTGRPLDAGPLPFVAVPTTAGTGSEVTKNAVITVPDQQLKVSLRDPRMVPDLAIVDADLMQGAPRAVALPAALDAVTQVIEPICTPRANPMTDALTRAAIPAALAALRPLIEDDDPEAWDTFAWVSTCGGVALANAGLGAVHGLAGVIGGLTGARHGAICGRLLPPVLAANRAALPDDPRLTWVVEQIDATFPDGLTRWIDAMGLPRLSEMGVTPGQYDRIAQDAANASSMKANPTILSARVLIDILAEAS